MSAKKISIINMKGGVGKTTLSVHLARFLAQDHEKKVLLIDFDPQANASFMAIPKNSLDKHKKDKDKKTVYGLFFNWMKQFGPFQKYQPTFDIQEYVYRSFPNNVDYQSHPVPDSCEGHLDIMPSDLSLSSLLRGASVGPYELAEFFEKEDIDKKYDYILIDCAPTYSILTTLALNATDSILIPMKAEPLGIHGTQLMKDVLEEHEHDFGKKIKILGVVYTMWDTNNNTSQTEAQGNIAKEWNPSEDSDQKKSRKEKNDDKYYFFKSKIKKAAQYTISSGSAHDCNDYYLRAIRKNGTDPERIQEFVKFVKSFIDRSEEMEKPDDSAAANVPQN